MPNLFGLDIAGIVGDAFAGQLVTSTFRKQSTTTRGATATAGTSPSYVESTVDAFIDDKDVQRIGGTGAQTGGRRVGIIGASLPSGTVPEPGDEITIEGETYKILRVLRDPAAALYTCVVEV